MKQSEVANTEQTLGYSKRRASNGTTASNYLNLKMQLATWVGAHDEDEVESPKFSGILCSLSVMLTNFEAYVSSIYIEYTTQYRTIKHCQPGAKQHAERGSKHRAKTVSKQFNLKT
jgi:hypothetical protein